MNILHVIIGLNVGGAELMLRRLIESHRGSMEFRHTVISLTLLGKVGQDLTAKGVPVVALRMKSILDTPRVFWKLFQVIRRTKPDVVQTWMYHADMLGGLASRLAGNPRVIWGVRTTDVDAGGKRATLMVRQVCAWLSHWVPAAIVCAADSSRRAHVSVGYDASKMKVIPNGFDLMRAEPGGAEALRRQLGWRPENVVVGSLGRFHAVKDYGSFIRACEIVAPQVPHARFMLVGTNLDRNNVKLMERISATGYVDRFALLGQRKDVANCLSVMDLLCLHSRTEGFPNVVGEAMAAGVPCVSTDVGDAALLIGATGKIVPKEDPLALAEGIKSMIDLPVEARRELGRSARGRVLEEFSMARCRERFEDVYREVGQRSATCAD
jgi:glycosyltransferase involved in cell wall biosynthesis